MRRTVLTGAFAAAVLLSSGFHIRADDAADPIIGTWKLNLSRSKYIPGPAPRSQTRTYRQTAAGIFVTIETVDAQGRTVPPIEFAERYDGKDYPVKGSSIGDAVALTRVNNYLSEATLKHAGMVVATTRRIITDDGKTLMLIYREISNEHPVDNVIVYERQ
jgi:hypothetical protein